ncbi:unnamed protein product [Effrenium voratum]|uniref:Uncharacterized protein n=1 Tax=Effrenium voratum TaxID=2562239 RepID=A0AA36ICN1_9DINO|nr:unnamed protein product [Effrenium voratum]
MEDFVGISPGLEAFKSAACSGRVAAGSVFGSGDSKITPLELDAQLQVSELIYRNLLLGKRLQMDPQCGSDSWYKEHLGEEWLKKNLSQRKELNKQAKERGENSPMWVEAVSVSSDLGSEVLQVGKTGGDRMRDAEAVDRQAVLDLLHSIAVKVRVSHYARCGVGEQQGGLRAMVAVMWHFATDAEVVGLAADCLRMAITGNGFNCDRLLALWAPMPPHERHSGGQMERGWSFLRFALDAFAFQAGEQDGAKAKDPEAALKIAQCVLAAKASPVMEAQLRLLKAMPADPCQEHRELKEMMPKLVQLAKELAGKLKGNEVLSDFVQLLA